MRLYLVLWSMIPRLDSGSPPTLKIDYDEWGARMRRPRRGAREGYRVLLRRGALCEGPDGTVTLAPPWVSGDEVQRIHTPFAFPGPEALDGLCDRLRRERVAPTMNLVFAFLAWASIHVSESSDAGIVPSKPVCLRATLPAVLGSVGLRGRGQTITDRMSELRRVGLISKAGASRTWHGGVVVHPI